MTSNTPDPFKSSPPPAPRRNAARYMKGGALVVVAAVLGYFVWKWANDMAGIKREPPQVNAIIPLPPPPPPPPEPEKPPEPEEPKEEEVVEPEPEPEPTPLEEPKPADETPPTPVDSTTEAMQMDSDGQAGSDAFNIAAGSGKGMGGSGSGRAGNATYSQYLGYALQKILRDDERTRMLSYRVRVNLWMTDMGEITRVELVGSSGDAEVDQAVLSALRAVPRLEERPPPSLPMPVRAALNSRRPA